MDDVLTTLRDYILMSESMELPFKKYSQTLRENHNNILAKYTIKKSEINEKRIKDKAKELEAINQVGEDKVILPPSSVKDYVKEGQTLKHCVLSYVPKVVEDKDIHILFVRKSGSINDSYITLELNKGAIVQAKKYLNQNLNQDEKDYIIKLAEVNGWKVEV